MSPSRVRKAPATAAPRKGNHAGTRSGRAAAAPARGVPQPPARMIHRTALLDGSFADAASLVVGAFAIVELGANLGTGCQLGAHAIVRAGCDVGPDVAVDSFAVLGGPPQVRGAAAAMGGVSIGARTQIREGVTVNRATDPDGATAVGTDCVLMANSHVGHDCRLGNGVTLANNVMLGGHVVVGDGAFLGGGAGVHQSVRIGTGAMIAGNASISYDVPPFVLAAERNQIHGLNLVGLRRSRIAREALADLKRCYHAVYGGRGDLRQRAVAALAAGRCGREQHGRTFLEFFAAGERGFARPKRRPAPVEKIR